MVCVPATMWFFFNKLMRCLYTADQLNFSFGTKVRGDSTSNYIFVLLVHTNDGHV